MKKIINDPAQLVREMGFGIELANPQVEFLEKYKIIKKREINRDKVCLISGGGSGHEPAHAGYVGHGMLDAAVCGDVFASPSQIQVYQAIRETSGNKGTLLIIKNYSGDMMSFKNAAYLAEEDGLQVDYVKVDDDIAVQDSLYTVGRRGVAGTVLVHKIAGACAQRGGDLAAVKAAAEKAICNVRSIGFSLSSCTVPAKGTPTFEIADGEMEYGAGIHGEPGIRREAMCSAQELAQRTIQALLADFGPDAQPTEVALLINGAGSTPLQELYVLNHSVVGVLARQGITVSRCFVGNYMTSIDTFGASVTLLRLDEELKSLLDDPCDAPAFPVLHPQDAAAYREAAPAAAADDAPLCGDPAWAMLDEQRITLGNVTKMVACMMESVIRNEVPFCEIDSHAGDGDFGMSIAKGFRQLRAEWRDILAKPDRTIGSFLQDCALVIMEHCGGASGPIWGSAFRAAGKDAGDKTVLTVPEFAHMMQAALVGIQKTGERSFGRGAVVGDKTLVDALAPCVDAWHGCAVAGKSTREALLAGADAAVAGAKATESIVARMGRAGTVGERSLGYPDAGAYGLGVIFQDVAHAMCMK